MRDIYFDEIDDVLEAAAVSEESFDEIELKGHPLIGDDGVILTYGDTYRVTDKGIIFIEGTYCYYSEETGELEPDWSLTVFYEDVPDCEFDMNSLLGYEQDGPSTAIHNFLRFVEEQCDVLGIGYDTSAEAVHRYAGYLAEQEDERSNEADEEKIAYFNNSFSDALCG